MLNMEYLGPYAEPKQSQVQVKREDKASDHFVGSKNHCQKIDDP
jgi:hypothetical protein